MTDHEFKMPQFPQKLPGSFWGITTFFNPNRYRNKLQNYRIFHRACQAQGLRLVCVELAFGQRPFELTEADADILIQRRANSIMWQKERLLNIALKNVPQDCDKVAWVDADVIFKNNNWISETCRLLEQYKVVQLFKDVLMLPKGVVGWDERVLGQGSSPTEKFIGKAYKMTQPALVNFPDDSEFSGHPGFAWAARRDCLEKIGFYDKTILGCSDFLMAKAFFGEDPGDVSRSFSKELYLDEKQWEQNLYQEVKRSVYYVSGMALHLWHGKRSFRLYDRIHFLYGKGLVPQDIYLNQDECWEWTTSKQPLYHWITEYFKWRNEEGDVFNVLPAKIRRFWDFKDFSIRNSIVQQTRNVFHYSLRWIQGCVSAGLRGIDAGIGQIGLFLKRHSPAVYFFLKKFKD